MHSSFPPNRLVNETSPYLLQHAHNPVDWHPWSEEAFEKAKNEKKLVLVSIGYSSCHWCHVMEKESFMNEQTARIMNDNFVCIKVDREERPDVDQVYMLAVQLMTGHGGWPLNCFTLPDKRPVYGGTYFPKQRWDELLLTLTDIYKNETDRMYEYADRMEQGLKTYEIIPAGTGEEFSVKVVSDAVTLMKESFDVHEGGSAGAPRFMMPVNYEFLLGYGWRDNDKFVLDHVDLTLTKMALGGIFDQVGGGFSRYSTDAEWKVPHFEKMLYDNAQLLSLYSNGYAFFKKDLYLEVIRSIASFTLREMTNPEGGFYSALDADSEGVEGKFYVWTEQELRDALETDFDFAAEYFNVNERGEWEGKYILLRKETDEEFAGRKNIKIETVRETSERIRKKLLTKRRLRVHPGLDDKSLASWNSLMMKGFTDAFLVTGNEDYLKAAKNCYLFIHSKMKKEDGGLFHTWKEGKAKVNGFLEDYSFFCDALIRLYEAVQDEKYITECIDLVSFTLKNFFNERTGFFHYTSLQEDAVVTRKPDLQDNVTPSSNSVMAGVLYKLWNLTGEKKYHDISSGMTEAMKINVSQYPGAYAGWANLYMNMAFPFYTAAAVGKSVDKIRNGLFRNYLPNKIFAGTIDSSSLSLFEDKSPAETPRIYVCTTGTCMKPVETVEKAVGLMEKK